MTSISFSDVSPFSYVKQSSVFNNTFSLRMSETEQKKLSSETNSKNDILDLSAEGIAASQNRKLENAESVDNGSILQEVIRNSKNSILLRLQKILGSENISLSDDQRFTLSVNKASGKVEVSEMDDAEIQEKIQQAVTDDKMLKEMILSTERTLGINKTINSKIFGIGFNSIQQIADDVVESYQLDVTVRGKMFTEMSKDGEAIFEEKDYTYSLALENFPSEADDFINHLKTILFPAMNTIPISKASSEWEQQKTASALYGDKYFTTTSGIPRDSQVAYAQSQHQQPILWALGFEEGTTNGLTDRLLSSSLATNHYQTFSQLTAKGMLEEQMVNEKFSKILEENKIQLNSDETLKTGVDKLGKIRVTGGIENKDKIKRIEDALNNDETLGKEILMMYAKLSYTEGYVDEKFNGNVRPRDMILLNDLLQRETGASLYNLSYDETSEVFKDTEGNADVESLIQNEFHLGQLLHDSLTRTETGEYLFAEENKFEIGFSYKNGVLMNDQSIKKMEDVHNVVKAYTENKENLPDSEGENPAYFLSLLRREFAWISFNEDRLARFYGTEAEQVIINTQRRK
ncbi:MAG: hypothetical protein LBJ67_03640 [Planctomycetaceae bacterium]|jgi:hypothetical protein|nr:hypothetical protein [Planctomycetaceae bacterium]